MNVHDLFSNLMCVHVHKICEDKFGGCKKSSSWLCQKVNKKIDSYGHDAESPARTCSRDDAASRQDIPTPFSILIEFETTEYSYSNRYSIRIRNSEDIRFDIRFE